MKNYTISEIKFLLSEAFSNGYIDRDNWRDNWRDGDIVELHNGDLCESDQAIYCSLDDAYCHSDDAISFHYKSFSEFTWEGSSTYNCLHYYNGDYYHWNSLGYNDIVELHNGDLCEMDYACYVVDEGEYYHSDDVYYWDSDGEYHLSPEPECGELFAYHDQDRKDYSGDSQFKVGVEIEKEDDCRDEINAYELYEDTGFIAERDSSLDSRTGFELVSPTFPLDSETIKRFECVKDLVNADYSDACGGHIHFSERGKTGTETYVEFAPIVPLLYALYPKRKSNTYSRGTKVLQLSGRNAINVLSNRVEFRIFPAVKSMANLEWRLELLRLWSMYKPTFSGTMKALDDSNSWLSIHLAKVCDVTKKSAQYKSELAYFLDVDVEIQPKAVNMVASQKMRKLVA
jgi:hypothetical protein